MEFLKMNRENIEEMENQRAKEIIESGHYFKVQLLIDSREEANNEKESYPIVDMSAKDCSGKAIAKAIVSLERILERLKEKYPEIYFMAHLTMEVEDNEIDLGDE